MFIIDDAVKFTSEMHDLCAQTVTYKREENKNTLQKGTGVEPAKHPPKVKSEVFSQLSSAREGSVMRTLM